MKDVLPAFVILALNGKTKEVDRALLESHGIVNYKDLIGSYKGTEESSYLVIAQDGQTVSKILDLAYKHNQESILYVNSDREASLIYTNPETPQLFLGKWQRFDGDVTKLDAWTKDVKEGTYYVCN